MFVVVLMSISGVKLARIVSSFTWNQLSKSFVLKLEKCGLMMMKVLFMTRSLTTGSKSGLCEVEVGWNISNTELHVANILIQYATKVATNSLL